jgi:hypothetical protein
LLQQSTELEKLQTRIEKDEQEIISQMFEFSLNSMLLNAE